MDLKGAWSLAGTFSADPSAEGQAILAYAVIPVSSNPDSSLHGYYFSPAYIYTKGKDEGNLLYPGNNGWQVAAGRGNLNFPHSIYRGFLQLAYRDLLLNNDPATNNVITNLGLTSRAEEKKSLIFSTGVSSTRNSLVTQHVPFVDTELLVSLRYDYEKGDFFSNAKLSIFYPTWIEFGPFIQWFKVFRQDKNSLYGEVADDLIFGPRIRGRAWNHLAYDFSVDWHIYHNFSDSFMVPGPRAQLSAILNF